MSSNVRLRRLADLLVKARKARGLTVEDVSKALDWSTGRLTYLELAKGVRADVGNVTRLLDLYEIAGAEREALLELARQSRERGWWLGYRDVFPAAYPGFEDAATTIRTYDNIVPGLLQTREYMAAIFRGGQVLAASAIERKVAARMKRQRILERDNPPRLWALIDEAALLRVVGGREVMDGQLRHLIERAAWPNITIQVLPNSAGAHAAMDGGFVLLDFATAADAPLVYLECATTSLFLEDASDVQGYTLIFERAMTSAKAPDETVAYLATLRDQLKKEGEDGSKHRSRLAQE